MNQRVICVESTLNTITKCIKLGSSKFSPESATEH